MGASPAFRTRRSRFLSWISALLLLPLLAQGERIARLTAGTETYSNVTVISKTATHVAFTHSRGSAQVRISSLDSEALAQLGLRPPAPATDTSFNDISGDADVGLDSDPVSAFADADTDTATDTASLDERLENMTQAEARAFLLVVLLGCGVQCIWHVFFGYCCRRICLKAQVRPGPLVWFPWLSRIPLLRAAGMSGLWILVDFIPIVGFIGRVKFARGLRERLDLGVVSSVGLAFYGAYLMPLIVTPLVAIALLDPSLLSEDRNYFIYLGIAALNTLSIVATAFSGAPPDTACHIEPFPVEAADQRRAA